VPATQHELLSLPGVGIKTAALVLSEAFKIPALCVDTHVHRISNRLGLVDTQTPEETQKALEKVIPKKYWRDWNGLLVMWGQNVCVPISPFCSRCPLLPLCPQRGVTRKR
jgi:endonuclease-3